MLSSLFYQPRLALGLFVLVYNLLYFTVGISAYINCLLAANVVISNYTTEKKSLSLKLRNKISKALYIGNLINFFKKYQILYVVSKIKFYYNASSPTCLAPAADMEKSGAIYNCK